MKAINIFSLFCAMFLTQTTFADVKLSICEKAALYAAQADASKKFKTQTTLDSIIAHESLDISTSVFIVNLDLGNAQVASYLSSVSSYKGECSEQSFKSDGQARYVKMIKE